ncbi:MAG TPA: UDP-N-acetylmuramoyl-L-alanyl-D-glutamate--2,6-diaminopimelate ligase [Syntrophales bacterium]|nr:UDP-N-acetylmuramoyl-L-alanyl-D-glutamate--2,6-diaminopimelate ligase [Syntrophales bacterium]
MSEVCMDIGAVLKDIEILEAQGRPEGEVRSICYDSRKCAPGSLFVAVGGLNVDGHDFIPEAVARGARFILHDRPFAAGPGLFAVRVRDSRRSLGIAGRNFYGHPSSRLTLIAVTGTNGKTTVTYLLEAILAAAGFQPGVIGTVNYRYGGKTLPASHTTPESLDFQRVLAEMLGKGATHVVAEISSHAIDLARIDDCEFAIGVFTNLTQDHLDYHGTMDNYFRAKKRFFTDVLPKGPKRFSPRAIVNADDPWGRKLAAGLAEPALTYGIETACDVRPESFRLSPGGIEASIVSGSRRLDARSPLTGRFNLYNILAAAAAAEALGLHPDDVRRGIASLSAVPGRMEKVSRNGQPLVFVDYAHTEDALRRVLQNLQDFKTGRILTVFGCGGDRDRGKRPLMAKAAAEYSDAVIVTSDNPRSEDPLAIIGEIEAGMDRNRIGKVDPGDLGRRGTGRIYAVIPDRAQAIEAAIRAAAPGDTVLIAGKGHEDYQIVGTQRFPFDDRVVARRALAGYGISGGQER